MFIKNLLLLTLVLVSNRRFVASKPCFSDFFGALFDYDDDDAKPATGPVIPPKITILLTPVADASSLQDMIQSAQNGTIFLLPSLFPFQHGGQSPTTTTTTTTTTAKPTTTTTAAPAAAPAAAAPAAAAPAAAAPAAAAPAAAAPAAAAGAPAAAPAPAAAG